MPKVGIEKLAIYPGALCLDLETLAKHRSYDLVHLQQELMVKERSVNPLWEDPVTMAVNAGRLLLKDVDKEEIGLLIVGTETGVDHEKTISSWVHGFLKLPPECRHFEIKSACYSGTAGLQTAVSWLLAERVKNKKALLITTDQSLMALNEPYEYVTGAGAVATLITDNPLFLALEHEKSGVYAHEVSDVIRPLPWVETGNSETSLFSYMEALDGAYDRYHQHVNPSSFEEYFNFNIYHVPFPGISFRAHKTLLQRSTVYNKAECLQHFNQKTLPSLKYPQRIGGTYGGSIFIALASLIKHAENIKDGDRIGIFSYGSGSCAEFYSGLVGEQAHTVANNMNLEQLLAHRYKLSINEYEYLEKGRVEQIKGYHFQPDFEDIPNLYNQHYKGKGWLVLNKIENYYRYYGWS